MALNLFSFVVVSVFFIVSIQGTSDNDSWPLQVNSLPKKFDSLVSSTETTTVHSTTTDMLFLQTENQHLHQLSAQIAETNRALEDLLASKLRDISYASLIAELRTEIDSLRRDVHRLKEEMPSTIHQVVSHSNQVTSQENHEKSFHWIQSTIMEMKNEIVDLNHSVNISQQIQQQQENNNQIHLIKGDITSLQNSMADHHGHQKQMNESIQVIQQEMNHIQQQQQTVNGHLDHVNHEIADLRLQLQLSGKLQSINDEAEGEIRKTRSVTDDVAVVHRKRHHHRDMKHEVYILRKMVKTLVAEQHDLQKQMLTLSQMRLTTESNLNKVEEQLKTILEQMKSEKSCPHSESIAQLQRENKELTEKIQTLNLKVVGVDQVQSSTLQLFEALETLEDKYDDNMGQLQRELSKLDFNEGQLTSQIIQLN